METLPVIVPGALFSMKIDIPIIKRNIIREVLYSHKELPRYQHALEILFCAVVTILFSATPILSAVFQPIK